MYGMYCTEMYFVKADLSSLLIWQMSQGWTGMIHDKHATLSYGEDERIFEYFSKSHKLISTHLQTYAFFHMTQCAK